MGLLDKLAAKAGAGRPPPAYGQQSQPYGQQQPQKDDRPLPDGWIKQWDTNHNRYFYVDTKATPPRSIWTHPDDENNSKTSYAPPSGAPPPDNRGWHAPQQPYGQPMYGGGGYGQQPMYGGGYGQPMMMQQPQRRFGGGGMGMAGGAALGLGAGMLGGALIADGMNDSYQDGYEDGGGGDFGGDDGGGGE